MKMTVNEAINSHQCLQKFGAQTLPIHVAVTVSRNQKNIADIVAEFEKQRSDLLKEHGEADDKGNTRILPSKQDAFNEAMMALVDAEVEAEIKQVTIESLGENFECDSNSLIFIGWMFSDVD